MKITQESGQSIIETTVAIGVILTAVVGMISLVSLTLRSTDSTVNRLIAQNLSWEGVEVAVNYRDSNYLAGDPYNIGLDGGGDTTAIVTFDEASNVWVIDFGPNDFTDPATILYREGGLYRQGTVTPTGIPTEFRRLVTLDNSVPDQITVTSTVQWQERENIFTTSTDRRLFDWR